MRWRAYDRYYNGVRCYVKLIQDSLQQLVQQDLPYVEKFIANHLHTESWLEHEWILKTLLLLPEQDAMLDLSMADGEVPGTLSRHNEPGRADDDLCGRGSEKVLSLLVR